jgi:hypothetical protein
MGGRDLKAEAVRAGVPLYRVAAEARMHPNRLSAIVNGRGRADAGDEQRIREAIARLAPGAEAGR